jgi:hypothetical protein
MRPFAFRPMSAIDSTESNSPVIFSATRCSPACTTPAGTTVFVARSVSSSTLGSRPMDAQLGRGRLDEHLLVCSPMYCTLLTSGTRRNSSRAWSANLRSSA